MIKKIKTAKVVCKKFTVDVPASHQETNPKIEKINHPSHYQGNRFEVIDIIEDFKLGFNLGNCLKYLLRAGKKHPGAHGFKEDLEKAMWYMNREIQNAENLK